MRRFPRAGHALLSFSVIWWVQGPVSRALADDYQGAKAVLNKIAGGNASTPDQGQGPGEVKRLNREIEDFSRDAFTLPAADAARKWVDLLDRTIEMKGKPVHDGDGSVRKPSVTDVFAVIPPPAAWDEIAKTVEGRAEPKLFNPPPSAWAGVVKIVQARSDPTILPPVTVWDEIVKIVKEAHPEPKAGRVLYENALRLIAHTLVGNRQAQTKDAATIQDLVSKPDSQKEANFRSAVTDELSRAVVGGTDDPDEILKALELQLERYKPATPDDGNYRLLDVPDLVTILGKEKAEVFLRKALLETVAELQIRNGSETLKLARDLSLELAGQLKRAQWELACSLEGGLLFEALTKRFITPGSDGKKPHQAYDSGRYQEAQSYYLCSLIAGHQTEKAVALAKEMGTTERTLPYAAVEKLERAGYLSAVKDFLSGLLADNPGLPFWNELISVSAKTGETGKVLDLARKSISRTDLSASQRAVVANQVYKILLAAGQTGEGVKELERIVASGTAGQSPDNGYPALKLARIGMLMENKDWTEEGIAVVRKDFAGAHGDRDTVLGLAELLKELNRGPEAESVLTEAMKRAPRERKYMFALLRLYHDAGRSADVLALLDDSPDWGEGDLSAFYVDEIEPSVVTEFYSHAAREDTNAGYIAAAALAATGRKAEAKQIVNAVLDAKGGFDPAYELLLKIEGQDAIPRLDELFSRDQFEPRPLIWKAQALKDAGKLEEAEKCARQAISIDPSDGGQGPGRRMRAYAVLADIREARGDAEQARFFRGAVEAIRLSEKADRFYETGLLSRAVTMYQEALTHFADAYCIQSRLALRMSELGQNEAAEEHYRRAYELMPESFGRVESHCFGCERAFAGQRAQGIAEKVFTSLAQKMPDKPQVHYLLGYLCVAQDRRKEALPHFQTAVKLDPQYLNAWKEIQLIGRDLRLPVAERDAVTMNILRLDPLGRHSFINFREVSDLRGLWNTVVDAELKRPPDPMNLYALKGSQGDGEKANHSRNSHRGNGAGSVLPGEAIWRNEFLEAARVLMQTANLSASDEMPVEEKEKTPAVVKPPAGVKWQSLKIF